MKTRKRLPSVKTLARIFGTGAKEARRVLEMSRAQLSEHPDGKAFIATTHHGYVESLAFFKMSILDKIGGFYGVESLRRTRTREDEYADYLNAGDTYNETLIYWRGQWRVETLGDFIEKMWRRSIRFN